MSIKIIKYKFFLLRKFSVNKQLLKIFGRISRKSAETVSVWEISSPGNKVENLVFYAVKVPFYINPLQYSTATAANVFENIFHVLNFFIVFYNMPPKLL